MALLALRSQHRLAGIVALSGYLPLRRFPPLIALGNMGTPVLMCHGDADPTVSGSCHINSWTLAIPILSAGPDIFLPIMPLSCDRTLTQVHFRFGQMSAEMLQEAGAQLEFKSYVGLHHGINTAEITDTVEFIASVLQ